MSTYIKNFLKFQPLLSELVARDVKIKYRRSVLGVLWTLLNPLCMMVILSVVFSNIFKFDVENFPLYVLSGQVIFNFFNDATTSSMTSIISNAALLKKIYVPKYLFVLARVFSSFINLMASACDGGGQGRIALDGIFVIHPAFDGGRVFAGRRDAAGSADRAVSGYHAFILRIYHRAYVSDTCYLSHVYAAGWD